MVMDRTLLRAGAWCDIELAQRSLPGVERAINGVGKQRSWHPSQLLFPESRNVKCLAKGVDLNCIK